MVAHYNLSHLEQLYRELNQQRILSEERAIREEEALRGGKSIQVQPRSPREDDENREILRRRIEQEEDLRVFIIVLTGCGCFGQK